MNAIREVLIEPYEHRSAQCVAHDSRAAEVAARIAAVLRERLPSLRVEHVGSTAVPGCGGKGIVDIAVFYPPGLLIAARALVDALGFQRQATRDPFPEDRPMRVGAVTLARRAFQLHVHIVAAESPEARELVWFRDRLRADEALRDAYVSRKQQILANGITDSLDYCEAKGQFIAEVLAGRG